MTAPTTPLLSNALTKRPTLSVPPKLTLEYGQGEGAHPYPYHRLGVGEELNGFSIQRELLRAFVEEELHSACIQLE